VQQADAKLQTLQAGPPADQVQAAQNAVNAAKAALAIAQTKQQELLSHPTDNEKRDAQARLASAQAQLDQAKTAAQAAPTPVDTATYDIQALQLALTNDQAQVDTIGRELAATKLQAPFAGTVVSVAVRVGDPLEPGQPAVVVTKSADAIVRADLNDGDASKVSAGQDATVTPEGKNAQPLAGTVLSVADAASGVGQTALIQLTTPDGTTQPAFGTNVQVAVKVNTKDDVLLIPVKAVQTA